MGPTKQKMGLTETYFTSGKLLKFVIIKSSVLTPGRSEGYISGVGGQIRQMSAEFANRNVLFLASIPAPRQRGVSLLQYRPANHCNNWDKNLDNFNFCN